MPTFRPANLNKRAYPGNASVIGPTRTATLGITTTICCTSTASCGAAAGPCNVLGCRFTHCCCPFCCIVCGCNCTVCDRTVPSGRYNASEQYEARARDAWGIDNCVTGSPTCLCCTNVSTCVGPQCVDCKGIFICCGPSTTKWFVAPSCTEVSRGWDSRGDAVDTANSLMGGYGWFIPTCGQLQNPGYTCMYWDRAAGNVRYWSNTEREGNRGYQVRFGDGSAHNPSYDYKHQPHCVRAFRSV